MKKLRFFRKQHSHNVSLSVNMKQRANMKAEMSIHQRKKPLPYRVILALLIMFPILITLSLYLIDVAYKGNGVNLSQWIAYIMSLVPYMGTATLGFVAYWQNIRQQDNSEDIARTKLINDVQPVLALSIINTHVQHPRIRCVSLDSPYIPDESDKITYKAFCIKLTNAGRYPIKNITINDRYISDLIIAGQSIEFTGSFDNVAGEWIGNECIVFDSTYFIVTDNGLPERIEVFFEDALGTSRQQRFIYSTMYNKQYYKQLL